MEGMKYCTRCGKYYPATTDNFYKSKVSKDGLYHYCKVCSRKSSREFYGKDEKIKERVKGQSKRWQEENAERYKEKRKEWCKKNPESLKKSKKKYFQEWYSEEENKKIHSKRASEWSKENRDKKNKVQLKYLKTEKGKNMERRRAQKRRTLSLGGGSYTTKQWEKCINFFCGLDAYTGLEMDVVSVDHIIPVTKGGTSYIWNLVPCEKLINSSKSNNDFESWYRNQLFFTEERLNKIYEWVEYAKTL